MVTGEGRGGVHSARTLRYGWFFVLLLVPFLTGGVVVGDEALLLKMVHGLDSSALSFGEYARSPDGWYIPHHVLWFALIYLTVHAAAFLQTSPLMTEAVISCQTVLAGLSGIVLCYTFLVRRQGMDVTRSTLTVLAFFAGGYGVYTFCMGGVVESYMVLAMSARLFFAETRLAERDSWKLAIIDALLVALKAYSLIFLAATWPLLRASGRTRATYAVQLGALLLILLAVKLWTWNPVYVSAVSNFSPSARLSHFLQQFVSPWTGLLFCMPVLLVLFWFGKADRKALLFKGGALSGCAAFFSVYPFFDGDVSGGRYIFPFLVALLPEIAAAISRILDRRPRAAWLLPATVFAFLPVAGLGTPFFPDAIIPGPGHCYPEHPVVRSWRIMVAKIANRPHVEICFHEKKYALSARDIISPRLGPWRVAYMLEGGHSIAYSAVAHDQGQRQHDAWGERLADRLRSRGLGSPWPWMTMGLVPALLAVWLSLWAALRINNPLETSRQ